MTTANDWLVRVGEEEYRAGDLKTVEQWCAEGRVPNNVPVHHVSVGGWKPLADASKIARKRGRSKALRFVVLASLLSIGSCTACTAGLAVFAKKHHSEIEKTAHAGLHRAEAALKAKDMETARRSYEDVVLKVDGQSSFKSEHVRAQTGLATVLALQGNELGAKTLFIEALEEDKFIAPLSSESEVLRIFAAAQTEIERKRFALEEQAKREQQEQAEQHERAREKEKEARTRAESEEQEREARAKKGKEREVKSRLERSARTFIEDTPGDEDISSVGEPYLNGARWAIQVYYVKNDHRGRRAKVTVVYFSPLNYEIIGSRDMM